MVDIVVHIINID